MKAKSFLSFTLVAVLITALSMAWACNKPQKLTPAKQKFDTVAVKKSVKQKSDTLTDTTSTIIFTFENYALGSLPASWSEYFGGRGKHTDWKITSLDSNKVMEQVSSDNPNNHFNIVVYDSLQAKDVELTVKFKALTGHFDQGGGLIWRFKDKNNYYVVRANPLEDNVVLYKVENGRRSSLPVMGKLISYGVKVKNLDKNWHTLRLVAKGNLFTVYLDGKELFQVKDNTFTNAGKIGLWTKSDAVTAFDDLQVKKLK